MASVGDAVAAAKLWLISAGTADLPYLSEGLYALVTVESDAVPTIAADERWRLYVNPTFVASQTIEQLAREIAHQTWHLLLDHASRARAVGVDRTTARAWGEASDLGVVDALGPDGVLPQWLLDASASLRGSRPGLGQGRSTEEYWARISGLPVTPDEPEPGSAGPDETPGEGSASDGQPRGWELAPDADVGGLEAGEAQVVRRAVAIEYQAYLRGHRGDVPGEAARWVRRLTEPRIPWEQLLAQAARRGVGWTSGRTHTTYTRPNRRAASTPGVLLPGWRRQNPTVACVIDTSGSVDDLLLGRAMGEVEGALRALGVSGSDVTVLACDAAVHAVTRVRRAGDAQLAGGGGTDLRVALAVVKALRPRPTLVVVFTDGYTPWPESPPQGCAVVVALLLRAGQVAPPVPAWASAIECQLD